MKKVFYVLTFILLLMSSSHTFAQQYQWAKTFDLDPVGSYGVLSLVLDNQDNKYVLGSASTTSTPTFTFDVDPNAGNTVLNSQDNDGQSIIRYFAKYDANGNLLWVKQLSGDISFNPSSIYLTSTNDVIIAGYINGTSSSPYSCDMNPDPSQEFNLTAMGQDMFFAKYSGTNGAFLWARQIQTFESPDIEGSISTNYGVHDAVRTIQVDHNDNVIITATLYGYGDFDLNEPSPTLVYDGTDTGTVFIVSYAPNGDMNWLMSNGMGDESYGFQLKTDANNNIYYANVYSMSDTSNSGIALAKITPDGEVEWQNLIHTSNMFNPMSASTSEVPYYLDVDNANNVYLGGTFLNTADFNPGAGVANLTSENVTFFLQDEFLGKYDTSGNFIWAKRFAGGSGKSYGSLGNMKIVNNKIICTPTIDATGSGFPNAKGDLDMGTGVVDTQGHFIAIYDTAANLLMYKKITNDFGSVSSGLADASTDGIYLKAYYSNDMDFDLATPTGLFPVGTSFVDMAFAKYNLCPDVVYNVSDTTCPGVAYQFGSQQLTAPGVYFNSFDLSGGCDSNVVLTLSVSSLDVSVTATENTLSSNISGATYQWINCANSSAIAGATSQSYTPTASGSYKVAITKNGCSDTSTCQEITITSVNDLEIVKNTTLYPNPTNGELNVMFSTNYSVDKFVISNILGQKIREVNPIKTNNQYSLDVSNLSSGVYFLQIISDRKRGTIKFVKQ